MPYPWITGATISSVEMLISASWIVTIGICGELRKELELWRNTNVLFRDSERYAGIKPPVLRSEQDFDLGAKYHIPANIPYIKWVQ